MALETVIGQYWAYLLFKELDLGGSGCGRGFRPLPQQRKE